MARTTEHRQRETERTRAATTWVALGAAVVFLILLVDFVAQNSQRVAVHFLGASGHASLAVMLLIAAVAGAAITLLAGSVRILQLRHRLHRVTRAPAPVAAEDSAAAKVS